MNLFIRGTCIYYGFLHAGDTARFQEPETDDPPCIVIKISPSLILKIEGALWLKLEDAYEVEAIHAQCNFGVVGIWVLLFCALCLLHYYIVMISSKGSASNGEVYLFKGGQKINQTKWQDMQNKKDKFCNGDEWILDSTASFHICINKDCTLDGKGFKCAEIDTDHKLVKGILDYMHFDLWESSHNLFIDGSRCILKITDYSRNVCLISWKLLLLLLIIRNLEFLVLWNVIFNGYYILYNNISIVAHIKKEKISVHLYNINDNKSLFWGQNVFFHTFIFLYFDYLGFKSPFGYLHISFCIIIILSNSHKEKLVFHIKLSRWDLLTAHNQTKHIPTIYDN
ncbi:hypothetical protein ACJX0J_029441 [Zea mays]